MERPCLEDDSDLKAAGGAAESQGAPAQPHHRIHGDVGRLPAAARDPGTNPSGKWDDTLSRSVHGFPPVDRGVH